MQTLGTTKYWDPGFKMRSVSSVLEITGTLTEPLATADYQFQDFTNFGPELKWRSVCAEGTGPLANVSDPVACSSIDASDNTNTAYARSYKHGLPSISL